MKKGSRQKNIILKDIGCHEGDGERGTRGGRARMKCTSSFAVNCSRGEEERSRQRLRVRKE